MLSPYCPTLLAACCEAAPTHLGAMRQQNLVEHLRSYHVDGSHMRIFAVTGAPPAGHVCGVLR